MLYNVMSFYVKFGNSSVEIHNSLMILSFRENQCPSSELFCEARFTHPKPFQSCYAGVLSARAKDTGHRVIIDSRLLIKWINISNGNYNLRWHESFEWWEIKHCGLWSENKVILPVAVVCRLNSAISSPAWDCKQCRCCTEIGDLSKTY